MTTRARSGFTLIELTIAIVLLAIGLLALAAALARALHVTTEARALHAALRVAEGVADSLASTPGSITSGSAIAPGLFLTWNEERCGGSACARVIAMTRTDTLSLLGAPSVTSEATDASR